MNTETDTIRNRERRVRRRAVQLGYVLAKARLSGQAAWYHDPYYLSKDGWLETSERGISLDEIESFLNDL